MKKVRQRNKKTEQNRGEFTCIFNNKSTTYEIVQKSGFPKGEWRKKCRERSGPGRVGQKMTNPRKSKKKNNKKYSQNLYSNMNLILERVFAT